MGKHNYKEYGGAKGSRTLLTGFAIYSRHGLAAIDPYLSYENIATVGLTISALSKTGKSFQHPHLDLTEPPECSHIDGAIQ